jgi:hypothetical protein
VLAPSEHGRAPLSSIKDGKCLLTNWRTILRFSRSMLHGIILWSKSVFPKQCYTYHQRHASLCSVLHQHSKKRQRIKKMKFSFNKYGYIGNLITLFCI